jgi:hypothetical protein
MGWRARRHFHLLPTCADGRTGLCDSPREGTPALSEQALINRTLIGMRVKDLGRCHRSGAYSGT